jgi:hypothetical protein
MMNTLKNKLSILLVFSAVGGLTTAIGAEISGMVIESLENRSLAGVNIIIKELDIGTASDANGRYVLSNIPEGEYIMTANMIGYCRQNYEISLAENDTLILPIELTYVVLGIVEDQDTEMYQHQVATYSEPITINIDKVLLGVNHFEVQTTIQNNTDLPIHLLRYPRHLRLQILTLDEMRIGAGYISCGSGKVPLPNTDSLFIVQPHKSKSYPVRLTSLHKVEEIREKKIMIRVIYSQKYLGYLPIPLVPCDAKPEDYEDEMRTSSLLLRGEYKSDPKTIRLRWFAH